MRILQIGPIPPEVGGQTRGGVATHTWELAAHLARRGHSVTILADNYPAKTAAPAVREAVAIYGTRPARRSILSTRALSPGFWARARTVKHHMGGSGRWPGVMANLLNYEHAIRAFQPDLIHVHHLEQRFPFAHFASQGRIPLVTTVHSTSALRTPAVHELVARNLRLARYLIFVSAFVREEFSALMPDTPQSHHTSTILHNPADSTLHLPIADARGRIDQDSSAEPLVVTVASLIPQKGIDLLVDAAGLLKDRLRLRVLIVGDGPERERLAARIAEQSLENVVFLEGSKPLDELTLYYNAADVFVLPSHMESFGLVYVEAMLCGCPVIGTPAVFGEIVPGDEYGLHVPPGDAAALALAIERALKTPWNRDKIRQYAMRFDWQTCIERFESVYNEVIRDYSTQGD